MKEIDKIGKKYMDDGFIDSRSFDFLNGFASDLEELRIESTDQVEFCLKIIDSSFQNGLKDIFD